MNAEKFEKRKKELSSLTDEQLNQKFWELTDRIVDPLVDLAYHNTSPSIERSVMLRMGFSSLEAKAFVDKVAERGLLGRGAGNILLQVVKELAGEYLTVGRQMSEGKHWEIVDRVFKGVNTK